MTPDEYLARERLAASKSEFFDGSILVMAGASEHHNLIVANLIVALGPQLRAGSCRIYPSDLKVRVGNRFFYPDVTVTRFDGDATDVVLNPTMLIEVLSVGRNSWPINRLLRCSTSPWYPKLSLCSSTTSGTSTVPGSTPRSSVCTATAGPPGSAVRGCPTATSCVGPELEFSPAPAGGQ